MSDRGERGTVEDGAGRFVVGPMGGWKPARVTLRIGRDLLVAVTGTAGETILSLGPFPEEEVVAIWRSLGASSGLPLAIETPEGGLEEAWRQLGPVRLGTTRDRRGPKVLTGRRPRFLVRRKAGRPVPRPSVYREREIAAGRNV